MRSTVCAFALLALLHASAASPAFAAKRAPIIDVHVHAVKANDQGPPPLAMCVPIYPMPTWDTDRATMDNFVSLFKNPACKDPIWSPETDQEVLARSLRIMDAYNVYGVTSGPSAVLAKWRDASPRRILPSLTPDFPLKAGFAQELAGAKARGDLIAIGELGFQYDGISVADPALEGLWEAAESNDVPVAIHFGPGPPGAAYLPGAGYRARLSSPLLLEDVLVRHPRLRVYVMHAGYPMLDDTLALLYAHPQVYVDTGVIVYTQPKASFYAYLKALVDAGFGKRIMFGSDQMVWPEAMERSIKVIEQAPFLDRTQKRDIFYNNAARFLKIDPAGILENRASAGADAKKHVE